MHGTEPNAKTQTKAFKFRKDNCHCILDQMEYDMDRMLEKIIPNEVSSIDGAILVSALLKTASFVADLHNIENDRTKFEKSFTKNSYAIHCPSSGFSCGFTIDDDGRITRLSLFEDQQELLTRTFENYSAF